MALFYPSRAHALILGLVSEDNVFCRLRTCQSKIEPYTREVQYVNDVLQFVVVRNHLGP